MTLETPYNWAIPSLGKDPTEIRTQVQQRAWAVIFMMVLLVSAPNGKWSRCPSTVTSITTEHHAALNTDELGYVGGVRKHQKPYLRLQDKHTHTVIPVVQSLRLGRWALMSTVSIRFSWGRRVWGQEVDSGRQGSSRGFCECGDDCSLIWLRLNKPSILWMLLTPYFMMCELFSMLNIFNKIYVECHQKPYENI